MAAGAEIAAGALLTVGVLIGSVAAGVVGLMAVAGITDHREKGYFVFKGGAEYVVLVAMAAVVVAALGPGRWSLDHAMCPDMSGSWWALCAGAGGLGAALALLAFSYRPSEQESA